MINNVLPLPVLVGSVWIMISIFSYLRFIPVSQKRQTNLVAFIGFCIFSPLVYVAFGILLVAKWVNGGLSKNKS